MRSLSESVSAFIPSLEFRHFPRFFNNFTFLAAMWGSVRKNNFIGPGMINSFHTARSGFNIHCTIITYSSEFMPLIRVRFVRRIIRHISYLGA